MQLCIHVYMYCLYSLNSRCMVGHYVHVLYMHDRVTFQPPCTFYRICLFVLCMVYGIVIRAVVKGPNETIRLWCLQQLVTKAITGMHRHSDTYHCTHLNLQSTHTHTQYTYEHTCTITCNDSHVRKHLLQ